MKIRIIQFAKKLSFMLSRKNKKDNIINIWKKIIYMIQFYLIKALNLMKKKKLIILTWLEDVELKKAQE